MILLNGIVASKALEEKLKIKLSTKNNLIFSIIQVGNIEASNKYIEYKKIKANELGIKVNHLKFENHISEEELIAKIKIEAISTNGMIVQLPLPKHLNEQKILDAIPFLKDVDGLSSENSKRLYVDKKNYIIPATARAVIDLLKYYNIDFLRKNIGIIGESSLIGKPIKELFIQRGISVKSYNKRTGISGAEKHDLLVVAAGVLDLIKKENVLSNSIIVDVGIHAIPGFKKVMGDVNFEDVKEKVYAISPVPGGVGPMTVISIFSNLSDLLEGHLSNGI